MSIYNEYEATNSDAIQIIRKHDVSQKIKDIMEALVKDGFTVNEAELELYKEISFMGSQLRITRASEKYRREKYATPTQT